MVIKLYKCSSDPKSVNKELSDGIELTGAVARDPVNVVNPVIEYEGDNTTIAGYNYAYIEDYNRYYFLTPQNDSHDLNTLVLRSDVLTTAAAYLRARQATITRNERLYNSYLTDPDFSAYAFTNVVTKTFPQGIEADSIILMTVG